MAELHGFAAACLAMYQDKLVDVHTGEQRTKLMFADFEQEQKSLIRGVMTGAIGDGLIIECDLGKSKKQVIINVWAVVAVTEVDAAGSMKDIYVDEEFRNRRR